MGLRQEDLDVGLSAEADIAYSVPDAMETTFCACAEKCRILENMMVKRMRKAQTCSADNNCFAVILQDLSIRSPALGV